MNAGRTVGQRLAEPSTWAGLAAILQSAVVAWITRDPAAIGATVAGLAAVFLPERGKPAGK